MILDAGPRRSWRWLVAMLVLIASCQSERHRRDGPAAAEPGSVTPDPSSGCGTGTPPAAARAERRRLQVGPEQRSYLLDAPDARGDRPLPVVLAFHGFRGEAANLRAAAGWAVLATREGFIAVHPEGHDDVRLLGTVGRGWDTQAGETRDLEMVRLLLDGLETERCVDRRRVFATGMSNGGLFANLVGCGLAARVAAVAPVAGARPLGACTPARPIPVLLVHGRADRVIDPGWVRDARDWWARANGCAEAVAGDGCERLRGCAADVVFCEGDQGHVWPTDATARIWDFFRAHPRPAG